MRVAMVGLRAPAAEGGVEQAVGQLAPRLVRRGAQVSVFCRPRYNRYGSDFEGVELIDVPAPDSQHLEALVHTLRSLVKARRFDLVHIHAVGPALWTFLPKLRGIPTVVTVHGADWLRDKWSPPARLALRLGAWTAQRFADAIVVVSPDLQRHLRRPAVHIPNGVSPLPPAPLKAARVARLKPGYLLFLGRLVPEKAVHLVIDAHRHAPNRDLVVTGGDGHRLAYGNALRARAASGVHFTGPRFGAEKAALVHNAAAMVFPSRLEGLPLGVLEAMASGIPVLASDIPAHRELLGDGRGTLLPVGDLEAWITAIRDLSPTALSEPAKRAKQHALERYDWEPIADQTLDLYRQLLK